MSTDINDQELNELYQEYWQIHSQMLDKHKAIAIAGVLVAQALTIYKTVLDQEAFDMMLDAISDNRNNVQKLDIDKGLLH